MKRLILILISLMPLLLSAKKSDNFTRLVIITIDGLRWQEVFSASSCADNTGGTPQCTAAWR